MKRTFSSFSPSSFEQFVVSVALLVFGRHVVVFGDGPDGGREATFEGLVAYPSEGREESRWRGYGVIQAKFKARLETVQKDQVWALGQLRSELDAFARKTRRTRTPDYYVFATNVRLTPPAGGGKDAAVAILTSYRTSLGIKDFAIWDEDQLLAFADLYQALRVRYRDFFTEADLLARLMARPDFAAIVQEAVLRELHRDEGAKLDQAGDRLDARAPLANVFIDLRASPVRTGALFLRHFRTRAGMSRLPRYSHLFPKETAGEYFVARMIAFGERVLSRSMKEEHEPPRREIGMAPRDDASDAAVSVLDDTSNFTGRFVLVGDPGSGKTTVTQFLAQVHRAALLKPRKDLSFETTRAIGQIQQRCIEEAVEWPGRPRLPLRIALDQFGARLNSDRSPVNSVLSFLVEQLRGDRQLTVDDLREWLISEHDSRPPLLVILDGLDEVPASSNRADVCNAIQDFLNILWMADCDVLVLATTRPQGYQDEFRNQQFEEWRLRPLRKDDAVRYARQFARERYGQNSDQIAFIADEIDKAAQRDLTRHLLQTPLLVTFMAILIATGGRPPRSRWKLFHDYFETIYKREEQKDQFRDVLEQRALIERLHQDVALLLHFRAGNAGGTESVLSFNGFRALVRGHLIDYGFEGSQRDALEAGIIEAATTRLVFLASRGGERLAFDVRSIQEFMAAERLLKGGDRVIIKGRMLAIAPLSHWRQVLLFMADACFASDAFAHIREALAEVADELNDPESARVTAKVKIGSIVALEILQGASVSLVPRSARRLAEVALQTLDLVPRFDVDGLFHPVEGDKVLESARQLPVVYRSQYEDLFRKEILARLQSPLPIAYVAWSVLLDLACSNVSWARTLVNRHWPEAPEERRVMFVMSLVRVRNSSYMAERFAALAPLVPPMNLSGQLELDLRAAISAKVVPTWCEVHCWREPATITPCFRDVVEDSGIEFETTAFFESAANEVGKTLRVRAAIPDGNGLWAPYKIGVAFLDDVSRGGLARALRQLAAAGIHPKSLKDYTLPWMLEWVARRTGAESAEGLLEVARLVDEGYFGDESAWRETERRMATDGFQLGQYLARSAESDGRACGPWLAMPGTLNQSRIDLDKQALIVARLVREVPGPSAATGFMGHLALWLLTDRVSSPLEFPPAPVLNAFARADTVILTAVFGWAWPAVIDSESLKALDQLGRAAEFARLLDKAPGLKEGERDDLKVAAELISAAFSADPTKVGLLRLAAFFAVHGAEVTIPNRLLAINRFDTDHDRLAVLILRAVKHSIAAEDVPYAVPLDACSPAVGGVTSLLWDLMQRGTARMTAVDFWLCAIDALTENVPVIGVYQAAIHSLIERGTVSFAGSTRDADLDFLTRS